MKIDEKLKTVVKALEDHGGDVSAAARSLGIPRSTYRDQLESAERAGLKPKPPPSPNPPSGMVPTGASILYGQDGQERLRWEKHKAEDHYRQQAIEETIQAFVKPLRGSFKRTKTPKTTGGDYMVAVPIGDPHIGLYSWGEETGQDWDSAIAEEAICTAVGEVISDSPATDECWIWQLGDFLHVDSSANTTAAGTPQDTDSRFPKVVRTAVRTLRYIAEEALAKYKTVHIRNAKGNHDSNAAVVLDEALKAFYSSEPRLIVHDSPKPVFIHRWHECLFGITHGHAPKPDRIPNVMANDSGEDWIAKHKFAHHGHFHQKNRKSPRLFQDIGVEVECHAAMTAPDKWTIEQGYRSTSEVKAIVYHKDEGEKRRYISQVKRIKG